MDARQELAEDIGLHYERLGLSSTAGRVLGVLLLEPDGRATAPELTERLRVAKSSMSVALTALERMGLLTRSRRPGERRDSYLVADNAFEAVFLSKFAALESFLALADRGVALAAPNSGEGVRLTRMRGFYAFMLREFPALLARWDLEATRQGSPEK